MGIEYYSDWPIGILGKVCVAVSDKDIKMGLCFIRYIVFLK